jgi:hypothetical protein
LEREEFDGGHEFQVAGPINFMERRLDPATLTQ